MHQIEYAIGGVVEVETASAHYLLHARMLRAMALLASPGQSVQKTSTAVGFDSLSSFTRAFTQFNGETPSTYRKRIVAERV